VTHDKAGKDKSLCLKYEQISISNAVKENEVTIELQDEDR
jgi:hypothetical protein